MKPEAIIFDFDGTLGDSRDLAIDIYNRLAGKYGYGSITRENFSKLSNMNVWQASSMLKVPFYRLPFLIQEGRKLFSNSLGTIKWFPELSEIISELKRRGIKLYLLSSNSVQNIQKFLDATGQNDFEEVFSSSLLGKSSKIKSIIKKHGLDRNNVWYIGDELRDIDAGKKSGVKTAAVTWGYNSPESLGAAHPDLLIHDPKSLLSNFAN